MVTLADFTLDAETLQQLVLFERSTGIAAVDCMLTANCAFYVVPEGAGRRAYGAREGIDRLSRRLGRRVEVVERAEGPEAFLRSLFRPYGVEDVALEEGPSGVRARVRVDPRRKGLAIGKGGVNLNALRTLARRHAGVEHIVLE